MKLRQATPLATLAAAAAMLWGAAAQAAPTTWSIDNVHSNVGFKIRHIFTKVNGAFTKFSGTVVYDPQAIEKSSAKAEIDAASINTANERRDGHLRSEDFFEVAKYPTIVFESTKVSGTPKNLTIEGNLTMHGVTKPVTLVGEFTGSGSGPGGVPRAGFEAKTTVNRKDFGIIWNNTLDQGPMLGDDVEITLDLEVIDAVAAAKAAEAKKAEARKAADAKK